MRKSEGFRIFLVGEYGVGNAGVCFVLHYRAGGRVKKADIAGKVAYIL